MGKTAMIKVEIETIPGGVPVVCLRPFGPWPEVWLTQDDHGRWRPLAPSHRLSASASGRWIDGLPPIGLIIDRALDQAREAAI